MIANQNVYYTRIDVVALSTFHDSAISLSAAHEYHLKQINQTPHLLLKKLQDRTTQFSATLGNQSWKGNNTAIKLGAFVISSGHLSYVC